ncbi:hypothetical protein [Aestuariivirga sp.]|uniref:hypothetical protein n=1 Tax=Aestuariivirga sp. TaxID=2650926 RepID=UPI0039E36043
MKTALSVMLLFAATPAFADDVKLIPFDDAGVYFPAALGKQLNIRLSADFAKANSLAGDIDGVILSELQAQKACFFGKDKGLDPDDPKLKAIARPDMGDVCIPLADVSVRYVPVAQPDAPPSPFYATDQKACSWVWKKGTGIALWAEDCAFDTGKWAITYDAGTDTFTLNTDGGDPYTVVRQFRKKPDEKLDALLPSLRKSGLIPDDNECQFAADTDIKAPPGWTLWQVVPTGERKKAFDAEPQDEVPDPPCGEVGYAVDSVGFFMVPDAHPDRVIHVDLGQDGTMFDPFTITLF